MALPLLWNWIEEARSAYTDDFSTATPDEFIAIERESASIANVATFAIYRDFEIGGYVKAVQTSPIVVECSCIFKREFYGSATTLPALQMVARQLFDAGIERITMSVYAHNSAIKSLIKKLGGAEEGRLRNYTKQNGQPVDLVIFGLLKADFENQFNPAPKLDSEPWHQKLSA